MALDFGAFQVLLEQTPHMEILMENTDREEDERTSVQARFYFLKRDQHLKMLPFYLL